MNLFRKQCQHNTLVFLAVPRSIGPSATESLSPAELRIASYERNPQPIRHDLSPRALPMSTQRFGGTKVKAMTQNLENASNTNATPPALVTPRRSGRVAGGGLRKTTK